MKNQSFLLSKDTFNKNLELSIKETELKEVYPVHCHDFYEIEIIIGGEGTQVLNGNTYPLKKGDIYILKPTDFHTITPLDTLHLYNIVFDDSLLLNTVLNDLSTTKDHFAHLDDVQFDIIVTIVKSLIYEINHNKKYSTTAKHNLLEYIVINIIRDSENSNYISQNTQLKATLSYIHENFKSDIGLEDVAAVTGYNTSYFSHWFHKNIGKTYVEYINNLRLSEAKKLLLSTAMSATEIGFAVGFSSFSGFLKEFKRKYGTTPSKFRKDLILKS